MRARDRLGARACMRMRDHVRAYVREAFSPTFIRSI